MSCCGSFTDAITVLEIVGLCVITFVAIETFSRLFLIGENSPIRRPKDVDDAKTVRSQ